MKKQITKIFTSIIASIFVLTFLITPVFAEVGDQAGNQVQQAATSGDCGWLGNLAGLCTNSEAIKSEISDCAIGETVSNVITAILNIFFFAVLAFAVYSTLRASIKYIRSEGNEKMVGEAKAAMRSILLGVGTMFICVIIILFLQGIFGANGGSQTGIAKAIDDAITPILRLVGICT